MKKYILIIIVAFVFSCNLSNKKPLTAFINNGSLYIAYGNNTFSKVKEVGNVIYATLDTAKSKCFIIKDISDSVYTKGIQILEKNLYNNELDTLLTEGDSGFEDAYILKQNDIIIIQLYRDGIFGGQTYCLNRSTGISKLFYGTTFNFYYEKNDPKKNSFVLSKLYRDEEYFNTVIEEESEYNMDFKKIRTIRKSISQDY